MPKWLTLSVVVGKKTWTVVKFNRDGTVQMTCGRKTETWPREQLLAAVRADSAA